MAEAFAAATEPNKARHRALPDRLTADDVDGVTFITTRLQPGYHEPEVDAFLDRVIEELRERDREFGELKAEHERLAEENARLRARLDKA
ncbi:DivIVA domain-containing protein [Thermomonospora umbrina]|uniref:Cell wall synthesis protein Wag31 n=1 Tax=Thermomonospora umbrina TaxID=111806 RepID=A0A3D9TA12_9ACTN|nr:DivIVA domain-containing protein [Thermomonospora umbrina]